MKFTLVYALQLFVVDVSGASYQPPGGLGADSWCLISTQNSLNYILSHDITLWDYIFFLCFLTRRKYSSTEMLALLAINSIDLCYEKGKLPMLL